MNAEQNNTQTEVYTNVTLRAHRYAEGDEVRHADSDETGVEGVVVVDELTYRVVIEDGVLNTVATYTLLEEETGNYFEDIADNADLVAA